jgi:hypothetical protein
MGWRDFPGMAAVFRVAVVEEGLRRFGIWIDGTF